LGTLKEKLLWLAFSLLRGCPYQGSLFLKKTVAAIREKIYHDLMPQPMVAQANVNREGVKIVKKKRTTMNEHARRQEAKFWAMMRAAEPGKRCLK
jgi:hypothetical protein